MAINGKILIDKIRITFPAETLSVIRFTETDYIEKARETLEKYFPNEPLFLGKQGKRLDRSQVYRFIVRACKDNGIKVHTSTHTLRRSFGYHHYQKFKDSVVLQKIFNHSSQRITLMYIGVEQDEIDLSYKNFELETLFNTELAPL